MRNVERTIWFISIIFMIVTLFVTNSFGAKFSEKEPVQAPIIKPIAEERTSQTGNTEKPMLIGIDGVDGYTVQTDLRERYVTITKNNGNLSLEIQVDPEGKSISEFSSKGLLQGPSGWKYYIDPDWDNTPGTTTIANIRKVFLTEKDGVLIEAYQYDYTGGVYDKEIEQILKEVKIYGDHW